MKGKLPPLYPPLLLLALPPYMLVVNQLDKGDWGHLDLYLLRMDKHKLLLPLLIIPTLFHLFKNRVCFNSVNN